MTMKKIEDQQLDQSEWELLPTCVQAFLVQGGWGVHFETEQFSGNICLDKEKNPYWRYCFQEDSVGKDIPPVKDLIELFYYDDCEIKCLIQGFLASR